ncbi:MAG: PilZ domain-containing protein [Candidatus Omnitrophota bacterium]
MKIKLPERRRFIRVERPLRVIVGSAGRSDEVVADNISPVGLSFTIGRKFGDSENLSLSLYLPSSEEPVLLEGKVVWQSKMSLEDNAPYKVGVEILKIDDSNKNVFVGYLCDLLYETSFKERV